ncbi:hypothetical protein I9P32_05880, partial [Campylobacter peloridis]|nr:hypothetical protein [Campylobacter peloridis]
SAVLEDDKDEFANLNENDIKLALGEEIVNEEKNTINLIEKDEYAIDETQTNQEDEMVNELSKSIAQTITSSITDDTLKAALKGMKMNININISFDESNKH